ncbi:MAG: hypothetical protein AAF235_07720 [Planctomycetota bacterium]
MSKSRATRLPNIAAWSAGLCTLYAGGLNALYASPPVIPPTPEVVRNAEQDAQSVAAADAAFDLEAHTAVAASRVVLTDLRLLESPSPLQYRATHHLLSLVSALAPDDLALARHAASAAYGAGDADLLREATKRVMRLDPDDTVSQLRLITSSVSELQTAEERLAAYERFLGRAGSRFDDSVRSRLALDAALLYRERGDDARFVELLTEAAQLDPTHKEAAILAYNYFASQVPDDALGQLQLQFNLLYADPFDPMVHMAIARLLAQEGAMRPCARFHNLGMRLLTAVDAVGPIRDVERLSLSWQLQGPQTVVADINARLIGQRAEAAARFEEDSKRDVPDDELVPPETVSLDPLYEKMRVLAALSAGDFVQVEVGIEELRKMSERALGEIRDLNRSRDPDEEAARLNRAIVVSNDLQFMRAIANVDIELFEKETREIAGMGPRFRVAMAPLAAWLEFRNGDPERAIEGAELIEKASGPNPATTVLKALAYESVGSVDRSLQVYRGMIVDDPLGPLGAWARSRALRLLQLDDARTPQGIRMEALAATVPTVIDLMIVDQTTFLGFTLDVQERTVNDGEPIRLNLSIQNLSSVPLALGPDRPLNSRVVLVPGFDERKTHIGRGQPEVIELNRRLRLMPRESVEIEIITDAGFNGLINVANAPLLRTQRWRAIQGFLLNRESQFQPGALCSTDDTTSILLRANPVARLDPEGIASALDAAGTDAEFARAVRAASAMFNRSTPATLPPPRRPGTTGDGVHIEFRHEYEAVPGSPENEALAPLARSLADAFESAPPLHRAYMLAVLPPKSVTPAIEPFDERVVEVMRRGMLPSDDAGVLAAALAVTTRAQDAQSPLIGAALTSPNERLRKIASTTAVRLSVDLPTFGTTGPGMNELAGPTRRSIVERARAGVVR